MKQSEAKWDVHKTNKKATTRKGRGYRAQEAYRSWFRATNYQPYLIKETAKKLSMTREQVGQCIINDRNLFRTWLTGQSDTTYRIGMALLDVQDFMIREEDYKKLLENFERDWLTQPVYCDRYTGMYHVPGFAWKEKNDSKIMGRQFLSFETKVYEGVSCGEQMTNNPNAELLKEVKRFKAFLTGGNGGDE